MASAIARGLRASDFSPYVAPRWLVPTTSEPQPTGIAQFISKRPLIALRKSAFEKLDKRNVFTENIDIVIRIHISQKYNVKEFYGDLNNFISGVCDGLMTADPMANLHCSFERRENCHVHPRHFQVIKDDFNVVKIKKEKLSAEKCVGAKSK